MNDRAKISTLLLKLIWFIPIPLLMIAINLYVDPAKLFDGGKFELEIVDCLVSEKNAANVLNHNHRLLQEIYAEKIEVAPQVLAIGSSRSMQISQDFFPDETFFNASVPNATLEDYMIILEFYLQKDMKPETVILGIDPWIFNRDNGITRWKEFKSTYVKSYKRITSNDTRVKSFEIIDDKYLALLSPSYLQKSLTLLFKPKFEGEFYATSDTLADVPIKMADGSYQYGKKLREISSEDVNKLASSRIEEPAISFNEVDPDLYHTFNLLLEYLEENSVQVVFYLGPYHPATYCQIEESRKYNIVCDVEIRIREIAEKKSIKIIGSYDPEVAGLGLDDFHDWVHARRNSVKRVFDHSP